MKTCYRPSGPGWIPFRRDRSASQRLYWAFMTAARLGETASVSESTVVRFAAQLGYDGYPEMQKALQELIRGKLTSIQRIQVSRDQMSGADILGSVMQRDMNSIHNVIEQLDRDAFSRAVLAAVLLAIRRDAPARA